MGWANDSLNFQNAHLSSGSERVNIARTASERMATAGRELCDRVLTRSVKVAFAAFALKC